MRSSVSFPRVKRPWNSPPSSAVFNKVKVKFTLEQVMEAQRGSWSIAPLFSTSTVDGVGGQHHDPAALSPEETRYPLYRRLGGPKDRSEGMRKISPPPRFDLRTVQPTASRSVFSSARYYTPTPPYILVVRFRWFEFVVLCLKSQFINGNHANAAFPLSSNMSKLKYIFITFWLTASTSV